MKDYTIEILILLLVSFGLAYILFYVIL